MNRVYSENVSDMLSFELSSRIYQIMRYVYISVLLEYGEQ
jgi:hypothetical protein